MRYAIIILLCSAVFGCSRPQASVERVVPAAAFSDAVRRSEGKEFSITEMGTRHQVIQSRAAMSADAAKYQPASLPEQAAEYQGDPRYLSQGYKLLGSKGIPSPQVPAEQLISTKEAAHGETMTLPGQPPLPPPLPGPPPGSSAPYYMGQMTANPSLWPDEAQGAFLLSDHRAIQAMDVITIVINESTIGKKKAETDAESSFSILAGIAELFGIETKKWAANNTSLDPAKLISAETNVKFEGEGETKREGQLKAKISAVVMEVFPNGLLRIEGTKIVSIDREEEIIVLSGLVRPRDISGGNEVDSGRVANMRIDFYGQGLLSEHQQPGWGARIFEYVWPF